MSDDVAIIERFVQLTWKQTTDELADGQALELGRLRAHLESTVAGATRGARRGRVGPAVTVGGSPSVRPTASPAQAPAPPPRAAPPASPEPTENAPLRAAAPPSGPASVSDVELPDTSAYTPSRRPVHARDYFGEEVEAAMQTTPDLEPLSAPAPAIVPDPPAPAPEAAAPTAAIVPDPPTPAPEAAAPAPTIVPDPPTPAPEAAAPAAAPRARASRRGRSALVYLADGTSIRGSARGWDPSGDVLDLRTKAGPRRIGIAEILVAFMGPAPGRGVEDAPDGRRVQVKLKNGKRLVGVTEDYEASRDRFTLLPDARSSGVDRVWIPAPSVESIDPG